MSRKSRGEGEGRKWKRGGRPGRSDRKAQNRPVWSLSLLQTNYFGIPTSKRSGALFIGRLGGYLGTLVPLALCTGGRFFFFWPLEKAGDEQAESRSSRGGGPESPAGRVQGLLLGGQEGRTAWNSPCSLYSDPPPPVSRCSDGAAPGSGWADCAVPSCPLLSSPLLLCALCVLHCERARPRRCVVPARRQGPPQERAISAQLRLWFAEGAKPKTTLDQTSNGRWESVGCAISLNY